MLLAALWFFLPAGLANGVPVLASRIPGLRAWNTPMDMGKEIKGNRIFGANKTWRGLIAGIITATIIIGLQRYLFTHSLWVLEHSWLDYRPASIWLLGPLFGMGALLADAIESFFKRLRGVKPGQPWFPFDQTDYIIGGCIASLFVVRLPFSYYIWVFFVWLGMHLLSSYFAYLGGLKSSPV